MFAIGDNEWAGISKLVEEMGELTQVCGKLMGARGDTNHWSGDLRAKFIEELGDVQAALDFVIGANFSEAEEEQIEIQYQRKIDTFIEWQATDPPLPGGDS
jgi:NTP pyrophosphatase (non-canonical NTP hydrolase)